MGMQERISLLDGDFSVRSQKGRGTKVLVKVPLKGD
jgi:signal transduction histidine kinase